MKKLLLLSLLCLATNTLLHGQIAKGTMTLGGEIGLGYVFAESSSWTGYDYTFAPSFGLMVTDHWMVGTRMGTSANLLEVNYYLNPGSEGNNYYVGAGYFIYESFFFDNESVFDFQFGFNKFLNKNIAFDANVTYSIRSQLRNTLELNLGLQPFMSRGDRDSWRSAASAFNRGDLLVNPSFATIAFVDNILRGRAIQAAFNPEVGLFLSEQTVVGLSLLGSISDVLDDEFAHQNMILRISPYLRYYLGNNQKHWRWYGQLGFSLVGLNSESNTHDFSSWGTSLRNRWGANWFLTSNLAFDIGLDLNYNLGTNIEGFNAFQTFDGSQGDRGFQVGASIGVQYFLQGGN